MFGKPFIKSGFLTCLAFVISVAFGQGSVPYRVGDKFGIADLSGKMIVPAEYDLIEMDDYCRLHFIAYKLKDTGNVSSVIINNTVVIKDQPYRDYSFSNDLFVGNAYTLKTQKRSHSQPFDQRSRLFSITGKDILNQTFSYISVIDDIDKENKLDEVLVVTTDMENRKSVLIYDRKQQKISRTIADKVLDLEAPEEFNSSGSDNISIVYVYRDASGNWQKSSFEGSGKVIKNETVKLESDWKREPFDRYGFGDSFDAPMMPYDNRSPENSDQARKIEIDLDKYYFDRKMEKIAITYDGFDNGYFKIIKTEGKEGLQHVESQRMIIPVRYDEIIEAEFNSRAGGFVIRTGEKYGLFVYGRKEYIIEPVFTQFPLVESENYFGTDQPLIKLYNSDGQFFCYANKAGKMYYREK